MVLPESRSTFLLQASLEKEKVMRCFLNLLRAVVDLVRHPLDRTRHIRVVEGMVEIYGERAPDTELAEITRRCREALGTWLQGNTCWRAELQVQSIQKRRHPLSSLCGAPLSGAAVPFTAVGVGASPVEELFTGDAREALCSLVDVLVKSSGLLVVDWDWSIKMKTADGKVHDILKVMADGAVHHFFMA